MDFNEENIENEVEEKENVKKMKQWFQDNMRIIISILIVVLIAGGIYSYSKRTEENLAINEIETEEQMNEDATEDVDVTKEITKDNVASEMTEEKTTPISISQETEKSFVETAQMGDSQTKLARKALANFLEKNPDAGLSAEHKIYIEDYLRKNVGHNGPVLVGTSIEFSKDLIKDGIAKSKTLNERQLQNLHKYAVRVPSLS